jgi:general stress protein YciG
MAGKQGLGSDNMSEKKKHEIQSAGGSASGANFKRSRSRAASAGREGGTNSRRTNR